MSEALSSWVRPIAYCEKDIGAQAILVSRIERGEIPNAPIWDDITTLRGLSLPRVDIIYAGFPCQSVSLAGTRKGMDASKSGLYFHVWRLIKETGPRFVFLENVWPGIRKFIPMVRNSLESIGYECRDGVLSAGDIGARHRRQRWFLLANVNSQSRRLQSRRRVGTNGKKEMVTRNALAPRGIANAHGERMALGGAPLRHEQKQPFGVELLEGNNWDEYASFFLRVDNGLPYRGDRIKSLGNTNPPKQFREAFMRLSGLTLTEGGDDGRFNFGL
jgi:DNA (cytosine-5)-methyltransferase 1